MAKKKTLRNGLCDAKSVFFDSRQKVTSDIYIYIYIYDGIRKISEILRSVFLRQIFMFRKTNADNDKRRSSAGRLSSSPAGAVTSLILMSRNKRTAITALIMTLIFIAYGTILFHGSTAYAETLTLNIDDSNLTLNLVPLSTTGTFSKSGNMNIAVNTDNAVGYTLSFAATNGDSLSNGSGSSINSIGTVSGVTSAGISEDDYKNSSNTQYNNTWAYKPSQIATGSFSSTYSNVANNNYLPLPDTTGQILAITEKPNTNNTVDNYTINIGSRITTDTPNGTYTSDAFTITAIANPMPIIMQELTSQQCQALAADSPLRVIDIRDNNTYTVRWINGDCWMTQNLRTTGTISAQYSNFAGADFNVSQYSLDSNDSSYANHCDSTNGFNYPCSKDSGSTETGVWYNYATASAGTITGSSNSTPATEDICPAGWHLPSGPNTTVGRDFNRLFGNTISSWQSATGGLTAFGAVAGGWYRDGELTNPYNRGLWWSANASGGNGGSRYDLSFDKSSNQIAGNDITSRFRGAYVRCVMKRQYMQDLSYDDLEEMMPNVGDTATLYDKRDEEQYSVAKLCTKKTGNECEDYQFWMTKNLNFAPDATKTYTHADTDLGYTTGDTSETWQPLASTMTNPAAINNFTYTTSANNSVTGWTNDNNQPHYAEGTSEGTKNGTEIIFYNGTKYTGVADCASRSGLTAAQCEHYKIGNYYNWSAAVASNDTSGNTSQYEVMPNSVCPAGWRLPKGLTNDNGTIVRSEFNAMLSANGVANGVTLDTGASTGGVNVGYVGNTFNTTFSNSPLYFVRSGYVSGATLYYFSGDGDYWSSTAVSGSYAYYLTFYSSGLRPAYRYGRLRGFSVRCVARKPETKTYMQDAQLSDFAEGEEKTLYDKRDEKDYTVKRINGELWMTQNLRYLGDTGSAAGTMTIGNGNSNVANKSITLYSLNSSNTGNFGAYSNHCDSTNGYNYACVYDSGDTSTGVWYNYVAASAETIKANSNSTAATSDICPAGWHLPSGPNATSGTDFNKLVGNTTSDWQAATTGLTAFGGVAGGRYNDGSLYNTGYGYWWSANTFEAAISYDLVYDSSDGWFYTDDASDYYYGFFVRCVRSD